MAKKINNMTSLTDDLVTVYEQLKSGKITTEEAKERSRVAGKIISACRTQIDYNNTQKNGKKVKFLE